jgi:D-alanine-D-alanine ligase
MDHINPKALGRVAVLMGGTSCEREISLMTGNGVLAALKASGVDAFAFDPAEHNLIELKVLGVDRAVICLHGRHGEDGTVQGALELLRLPYTGSGVMASAIAMDKCMAKAVWLSKGLPMPRGLSIACSERDPNKLAAIGAHLGYPFIIKPPAGGSSIGVTKVARFDQVAAALEAAAPYGATALCEEFVDGVEATCGVLAFDGSAKALPVVRIAAPNGDYDYQNKYFSDDVAYHCPSGLTDDVEHRVRELAVLAFNALNCRGWGRADFMIRKSDRRPMLLEMNTSPGMTSHSLLPMAAAQAGIGYEELCLQVAAAARLD